MERSSASADRRARLKHWLLSRRHLRTATPDHPDTRLRTPLMRDVIFGLIGWSLTRTALLFSVTPLPLAAVLATPTLPLAPTLGVLFGLWQGAPHPMLTIGSLAVGLVLRLTLRLFFQPMSDAKAAAQHRQVYLAHWRLLLRRCMLPFLSTPPHGSKAPDENAATVDQASSDDPTSPEDTAHLAAIDPLPVSSRTLNAVLAATVGALFYCLHGAFAFYDLWGALLYVCGCAIACPLFCFSFDHIAQQFEQGERPCVLHHGSLRPIVGHAALLCAICFCLRGVRFLSLMPALALLLWLSLLLLQRYGLLLALGCAVLGGLVIGTPSIPALGVSLVIYALLSPISPKLAPPCSLLGALLTALSGGKTLFFELAPSLCVGMVLLTATRTIKAHQSTSVKNTPAAYRHDPIHAAYQSEKMRFDSISNRLSAMSTAFGGLGELLLRTQQAPSAPPALTDHDMLHAPHDAGQYTVIAGLFRDALAENFKTLPPDDELATQIGQQLRQANAKFRRVVCLTHRGRCLVRIEGCTPTHIGMTADALRLLCEEESGCMLRAPVFDEDSEEGGVLLLRPRPALRVRCISRSCAAGQAPLDTAEAQSMTEEADPLRAKASKSAPCGDSIRFFSDGQERFFALLCDGMGSGEDAAAISGICVSFLERLLRAGVGIDSALTLLNRHLCSRTSPAAEITSTVDLISMDLFSGKAHFIKSGAADSLILRGDQWYTVSSRTYPLGVLHSVDAQIIPFPLQAGDQILMMSDGVMDTLLPEAIASISGIDANAAQLDLTDQPGWLYALLDTASLDSEASVRDFLDRILASARQRGSADDMTVAMLHVQEDG